MSDQPLYTHGPYSIIRRADNRLGIRHRDGYTLPDAPCTLAEAQAFIADYCECRVCEGDGWEECPTCQGDPYLLNGMVCPHCLGRGYILCARCGGKGEEI